jgi:hypothetical protein
MSNSSKTIDFVKSRIVDDYQATSDEADKLSTCVRINFQELCKFLKNACHSQSWNEAARLCEKLEALALNLNWPELRQAGTALNYVIENRDADNFVKALHKLESLFLNP